MLALRKGTIGMTQYNCKSIGLTGGIATGKSTVSNIIREKNYIVIDADKISREVLEKGKPAYKDVVETFGLKILLEDETINRKKLGRLIFSSARLRKALNDIVHPYIIKEIKAQFIMHCKNNNVIFLDIPLLVELQDMIKAFGIKLDEIWLVYADKKTQLERLIKRDDLLESDALDRINSQLDTELKKKHATKIIYNTEDIHRLKESIDEYLSEL